LRDPWRLTFLRANTQPGVFKKWTAERAWLFPLKFPINLKSQAVDSQMYNMAEAI
jgi:hypothetical protein